MNWRVRLAWMVLALACVAATGIIVVGHIASPAASVGLSPAVQVCAGLCLVVALGAAHWIEWWN